MTADQTADTVFAPFFGRVFSRVGIKVTLVLTAIIIFVELFVLIPSYFGLQRDLRAQVRSEAVAVLGAALGSDAETRDGAMDRGGAFLTNHGFLRGGVLYDANGTERIAFGERPTLDIGTVARDGTFDRAGEDGSSRDFFIPFQETGLALHAIVRTDTQWINDRLNGYLLNVGLIVLVLALACFCGLAVAMDTIVFSRLFGLRDAVAKAIDRPDIADSFVTGDTGNDELGELGRTIDGLLLRTSDTYQEDLAAAAEITRNAPQAVLVFGPDRQLIGANDAALILFNVASIDALQARAGVLLVSDFGSDMEILDLAAEQPVTCQASARGAEGRAVPCTIHAMALDRPDGAVLRFAVYLNDRSEARGTIQALEDRADRAEGRVGKLHDALEACIAIISVETGGPPETPVQVSPERAISAWIDEVETSGRFSRSQVAFGTLPAVMLPPDCADELFRKALSLCLISIGETGRISIATDSGGDGAFRFRFAARATSHAVGSAHPANETSVIEAAVRKLATRAGATVEIPGYSDGDDEWLLFLTLPSSEDTQGLNF